MVLLVPKLLLLLLLSLLLHMEGSGHLPGSYAPCVYNRCCADSAQQAASYRYTSSSGDKVRFAPAQC
jgi:hypothetical protein